MNDLVIRAYRGGDEAALLAVWNEALPLDPVDAAVFRRQVVCDPNFRPDGLLVAEANGQLVGFCLGLIRRLPLEKVGLEPERGWITAFGVVPRARRQGVGQALLAAADEWFIAAGRREVLIAPYIPNYFVPGVDERGYADGLAWLIRHGFELAARSLSMDANLVAFEWAAYQAKVAALAERGIAVRHLRADELPEFLGFLEAHMSGDWLRHGRKVLLDCALGLARLEQITVAVADGELVGYCQHEGEHFGPFGVIEARQGQGIGSVLLAHCLESMRRAGLHNAWVLWTSDHTAEHVYGRFGFRETRRFSTVRRRLVP